MALTRAFICQLLTPLTEVLTLISINVESNSDSNCDFPSPRALNKCGTRKAPSNWINASKALNHKGANKGKTSAYDWMKNWFLNELSCKCHLTLRPSTWRWKQQTNNSEKLCHRSRSIKFSVYNAFPRLSRQACSLRRSQTIIHLSGVYLSSSKQKFINSLLFHDGARWKRRENKNLMALWASRVMCRCRRKRFRIQIGALSTSTSANNKEEKSLSSCCSCIRDKYWNRKRHMEYFICESFSWRQSSLTRLWLGWLASRVGEASVRHGTKSSYTQWR